MLPITTGVLPFGLVMGTVASHAELSSTQAVGMNIFVFAGASLLAVVDLMLQGASSLIVLSAGLIINLRFMLYSADFAPFVQNSSFLTKFFCSYTLTDQSYSCLKANETQLKNQEEAVQFYLGAAICMLIAWQGSVVVGYFFGNILSPSLSLDYAIPLSFVALVMPTLKNRVMVLVAISAALFSVILRPVPFNLGLLLSVFLALGFGAYLTKRPHRD